MLCCFSVHNSEGYSELLNLLFVFHPTVTRIDFLQDIDHFFSVIIVKIDADFRVCPEKFGADLHTVNAAASVSGCHRRNCSESDSTSYGFDGRSSGYLFSHTN